MTLVTITRNLTTVAASLAINFLYGGGFLPAECVRMDIACACACVCPCVREGVSMFACMREVEGNGDGEGEKK